MTVRIPIALAPALVFLVGQSAMAGPAAASQAYPVSYHSFTLFGNW